MEQKILKVDDVIEFNGKKYRAVPEVRLETCKGCAFQDVRLCPTESSNCITGGFIFEEVKEPPRHIELGVLRNEGNWVIFKIVEQTHRGNEFCQQTAPDTFKSSNGIELVSVSSPAWEGANRLYCCGFCSNKDNIEIVCTTSEFARISEAVNEYNTTNGKGYEKPWPQTGDNYFYILENGAIHNRFFYGDKYDRAMRDYGNFFRTEEEAEAMADKIKTLLKELAAK